MSSRSLCNLRNQKSQPRLSHQTKAESSPKLEPVAVPPSANSTRTDFQYDGADSDLGTNYDSDHEMSEEDWAVSLMNAWERVLIL